MKYLTFTVKILLGIVLGMLLLSRIASSVIPHPSFAPPPHKDSSEAAPKLETIKTNVDLGAVDPESHPTATFSIRNSGNGRLILYRANSDCGCVASDASPLLVGPGETQSLVVELPSDRPTGPWTHTASYQTNDPNLPLLSLTCQVR